MTTNRNLLVFRQRIAYYSGRVRRHFSGRIYSLAGDSPGRFPCLLHLAVFVRPGDVYFLDHCCRLCMDMLETANARNKTTRGI